jgi:hypothetical protein
MNLDLNNPIFVLYINVHGMSRQRAEEAAAQMLKNINYDNITTWCIPIENQDSRIELIWKGHQYEIGLRNPSEISKIEDRIKMIIDITSKGASEIDIKQRLREILIGDIID